MATKAEQAFESWEAAEGQPEGTGSGSRSTRTASTPSPTRRSTTSSSSVHPRECKELSPWGVPIAHGFLTLSMLVHLNASIEKDMSRYDGVVMGVNYGFEKGAVHQPGERWVPHPLAQRAVEGRAEGPEHDPHHLDGPTVVEIEGEAKPAVVAERVTRLVYG